MKIIDLLNKIANGEEVPKKIKFGYDIYELGKNTRDYYNIENKICLSLEYNIIANLNDEIEILEEKKFTKEDFIKEAMVLEDITREQFNKRYEVKECNCGRGYCKGFIKIEKVKEKKKIPEKLPTWFSLEATHSKEDNIEYANANFENMYEKINEICDYLKSKDI